MQPKSPPTKPASDSSAPKLSHVDERGNARMVDVSEKDVTKRRAEARGRLKTTPGTLELILEGRVPKGDVLAVARVAGIMAAKKTSELIPLCHPLPISSVEVDFTPDGNDALLVSAKVSVTSRTGAEMEALTAVAVAGLTVYDMCKAVDREMTLESVELVAKSGGRSGDFVRGQTPDPDAKD